MDPYGQSGCAAIIFGLSWHSERLPCATVTR